MRVAACVLLLLSLLTPPARAGVLDAAMHDEAVRLEGFVDDHLWYGQIVAAAFNTPDKLPGDVHHLGGGSDSALWTGVYLAGESYRYAVARQAGDTAAMAAAKARIDQMVDGFHLKINISRNWKAAANGAPEGYDYRPGLVDGEAGQLFRACFPAGVPSWQQDQRPNRHRMIFGPIHWDGKPMPWVTQPAATDYYCEAGTSRDQHAGATFGLLAAYDLVGPDDTALRDQIRSDILTLTGYLHTHGWSVVRPYTRVETAGSENFVFPLFVINPQPRLNMVQAARHVARGTPDALRWEAVWATEFASQTPLLPIEYQLAIGSPHNSYYNFNLNHLTNFNVISREPNRAARELFKRNFSIIDQTTRDDVNAHFETITFALTGERARLRDAVTHLRQWIDYRALADEPARQNSSARCGVDLVCVPRDQVTYHQDGAPDVVQPGTATQLRSSSVLPVTQRTKHHDFLWQRSPYELDNGGPQPNDREPGVDYLTPYWMLRYHTEVAPPALAPFPAWAGPTAS